MQIDRLPAAAQRRSPFVSFTLTGVRQTMSLAHRMDCRTLAGSERGREDELRHGRSGGWVSERWG